MALYAVYADEATASLYRRMEIVGDSNMCALFARAPALSLPKIPVCAGSHLKAIRQPIFSAPLAVAIVVAASGVRFSNCWRRFETDRESEQPQIVESRAAERAISHYS